MKWFSFLVVLLFAGLVSAGVMGVVLLANWSAVDTCSVNSSVDFVCADGTQRFFSTADGEVLESCSGNAIVYSVHADDNSLRLIANDLASSDVCLVYGVVGSQEKQLAVGFTDFNEVSTGQNVCFKWERKGAGLCQIDFDINRS